MNSTKPEIIAVIPCYNTADNIAEVVQKAIPHVDHVIVIDDGSTDATAKAAEEAGATVIKHDKNLGKGAAMKEGAQQASPNSIIVFIDGDGQHNASEIPLLLKPIVEDGVDFVIGSRYMSKSNTISPPFKRKSTNFVANVIISTVVTLPITPKKNTCHKKQPQNNNYRVINGRFKWFTDCTGGFRALKTESWQKLKLTSDGFQIETEMLYEAVKNGLLIAEVPASCTWKGSTSKLSIIRDGAKTVGMLAKKVVKR